jgi:hypothetical protein
MSYKKHLSKFTKNENDVAEEGDNLKLLEQLEFEASTHVYEPFTLLIYRQQASFDINQPDLTNFQWEHIASINIGSGVLLKSELEFLQSENQNKSRYTFFLLFGLKLGRLSKKKSRQSYSANCYKIHGTRFLDLRSHLKCNMILEGKPYSGIFQMHSKTYKAYIHYSISGNYELE